MNDIEQARAVIEVGRRVFLNHQEQSLARLEGLLDAKPLDPLLEEIEILQGLLQGERDIALVATYLAILRDIEPCFRHMRQELQKILHPVAKDGEP